MIDEELRREWMIKGAEEALLLLRVALMSDEQKLYLSKFIEAGEKRKNAKNISNKGTTD